MFKNAVGFKEMKGEKHAVQLQGRSIQKRNC